MYLKNINRKIYNMRKYKITFKFYILNNNKITFM